MTAEGTWPLPLTWTTLAPPSLLLSEGVLVVPEADLGDLHPYKMLTLARWRCPQRFEEKWSRPMQKLVLILSVWIQGKAQLKKNLKNTPECLIGLRGASDTKLGRPA